MGRSSSSDDGRASSTSSRVIPARQPDSSEGVSSRPPSATNTLVPVPSHSRPRVLGRIASVAPTLRASARATTFSA